MEGINLLLFLISVFFISMSAVMMPGPVFAVTIAKKHKEVDHDQEVDGF